MKSKTKKIIFVIIIFIFVLLFLGTTIFAGDRIRTEDYYHPLSLGDATYIFKKGALVLNVLRIIAALVSVVVITILGIRYMVGSVEQKAEYKQTMVPVVVGCLLITSLSTILSLIVSAVQ